MLDLETRELVLPLAPRPRALAFLPFPFAEDFIKQRDHAFDVVVCDIVVNGLPLSSRCHKAIQPKASKLLRHGWLAQRQRVFEVSHGALFLGEKTEKEQPRLMRESFQEFARQTRILQHAVERRNAVGRFGLRPRFLDVRARCFASRTQVTGRLCGLRLLLKRLHEKAPL